MRKRLGCETMERSLMLLLLLLLLLLFQLLSFLEFSKEEDDAASTEVDLSVVGLLFASGKFLLFASGKFLFIVR